MKPVKIKENVYWVGGVDWDLRNFHGYLTQRGSTYNSYLIIDEKITLIDGVKHYLFPELIERISEIVDPAKIDYIIHNHVEMDHSGSLPQMLKVAKNAKIFASPNGEKGLKAHYGEDIDINVVKTGDTLNIGKRELCFVLTPMVHWPDNMVTWSAEDKILFSNDSFGQHIASSVHFDDEYPMNTVFDEAQKYYANIVLPYGVQVQKAMATVKELQPEVIAPSHGLIWRKYIPEIMSKYDKWASNNADERAVIIYDTMWGSTQKLANAIARGFEHSDVPFQMFNLQYNHISDIMTELVEAKYICVGSPTLNNNILPTNASFLTYLKGLAPKNRVALAFGSYGWGGQSIGIVRQDLEKCKFKMWDDIKHQYIPSQKYLENVTETIMNNLKEERKKMIKKRLVEEINAQINRELNSEYIYLDMATYFEKEGLTGFAQFFKIQVQEERFHAMKFYQYLADRDGDILLKELANPHHEYKSPMEVFEKAYAHEQYITKSINDLMAIAIEEKDYATVSLLNWFVDEQVEEEATMSEIIDKLKLIEGSGRGHGLMMLDKELGARTFTPPTNE